MSTENELILKEIRELKGQVNELKGQVSLNCNKLDIVTKKVSENGKQIDNFYRSFGREIGKIQQDLKELKKK